MDTDTYIEMDDQTFSDTLVDAVYKKNLEPFFEDNVIERTFSTLRDLVNSSESRALAAKEFGDDDLYRRASSFKRMMQRTLATHKYKLSEAHRKAAGNAAPGSTKWRRLGIDALALIEEAVDSGCISDDAIHDKFVDFLDSWENGDYYRRTIPQ